MYKSTFSGTGDGFIHENLDDAFSVVKLNGRVMHLMESKSRK